MINLLNSDRDNLIAVEVSGKVSKEEVENLHPLIDKIIAKNNKVDFYFELHDFYGYDLEGLWADLKIDAAHISDYGNMAIVGDKIWQEKTTKVLNFFSGSQIKYFDLNEKDTAKAWIGLVKA
ncbi:STAS/SEC14 domain-containing protein [Salinimicrobium sp. CDJ15-81-2]|uniref:STAS/SEC14 domain-containing protein n=4 Tax=Flavobacteriaceae TaxID=49546 RepID=A0A9X3CZC7_9FLAO|nr:MULTISPECIES: STAS/SEC14 domain-containing protein [Flavobacteriaceae]MCX2838434.1 STAS/SEC14 domain-containing protein [Salinimicrobium profundisediminis]MDT0647089.1 STAS/SEC14 domain-containing protein [Zunongwangia sp. F260]NJW52168.1 STAS/SEC14 domain-containing protein [Salinimicrobium oceani]NJY63507.1 STAS/SEC14 domain-containing protein [Salinimicrobium nanhaiense]